MFGRRLTFATICKKRVRRNYGILSGGIMEESGRTPQIISLLSPPRGLISGNAEVAHANIKTAIWGGPRHHRFYPILPIQSPLFSSPARELISTEGFCDELIRKGWGQARGDINQIWPFYRQAPLFKFSQCISSHQRIFSPPHLQDTAVWFWVYGSIGVWGGDPWS